MKKGGLVMSLFKKNISDALEDVKDKAGELKKKAEDKADELKDKAVNTCIRTVNGF